MEEVKIRIYDFMELNNDGRNKVREFLKNSIDGIDYTDILELVESTLEENGFSLIKNILWNFSYSQGDGIAFYGKVDLKEYLEKQKINLDFPYPDLDIEIIKVGSHLYNHEKTMELKFNLYDFVDTLSKQNYHRLDILLDNMESVIRSISLDLKRKSYKIIEENEYNEFISEYCINNNMKFFKNGSFYIPDSLEEDLRYKEEIEKKLKQMQTE